MKTMALISLLARDAGPAPQTVAARRLIPAVALGLAASGAGALALIGLVPMDLFSHPGWWLKLGCAVALALACAWLLSRLALPLARTHVGWWAVAVVALAMAGLGAVQSALGAPGERMTLVMGHSWVTCPWNVFALSLPGLAGVFWALRGLAPTRLRSAGFVAGLLAGALGAAGYALSCTEVSMAFVAVWYSLGILMTGGVGATLGPRLLRW